MDNIIEEVTASDYKYGFVTQVETETIARGLNEEVVRMISAKKMSRNGYWIFVCRLIAIGRQ